MDAFTVTHHFEATMILLLLILILGHAARDDDDDEPFSERQVEEEEEGWMFSASTGPTIKGSLPIAIRIAMICPDELTN